MSELEKLFQEAVSKEKESLAALEKQLEQEQEKKLRLLANQQKSLNRRLEAVTEREEKASEEGVLLGKLNLEAKKELKTLTDKIEASKTILNDIKSREKLVAHREKLAETRFQSAFAKEQALQDKKNELIQLKQQIAKGAKEINVEDVL